MLATIIGTLAALALERVHGPAARCSSTASIYIAIMVPGIVIGIATLIALVTVFDVVNPVLAQHLAGRSRRRSCSMGYGSIIAAHVLFTIALVDR